MVYRRIPDPGRFVVPRSSVVVTLVESRNEEPKRGWLMEENMYDSSRSCKRPPELEEIQRSHQLLSQLRLYVWTAITTHAALPNNPATRTYPDVKHSQSLILSTSSADDGQGGRTRTPEDRTQRTCSGVPLRICHPIRTLQSYLGTNRSGATSRFRSRSRISSP